MLLIYAFLSLVILSDIITFILSRYIQSPDVTQPVPRAMATTPGRPSHVLMPLTIRAASYTLAHADHEAPNYIYIINIGREGCNCLSPALHNCHPTGN